MSQHLLEARLILSAHLWFRLIMSGRFKVEEEFLRITFLVDHA